MAITFPRTLPSALKVVGMTFMPQPMIEVSPLTGGDAVSADLGPTLWRPSYKSTNLNNENYGIVRSLYDTLLSTHEFYAYDKWRQYPLAYKNGWGSLTVSGSPFDGTCKIKTVASAVSLVLKTLPTSGFILSIGDYLSFGYGANGNQALHRIAAGGVSSSGEMTVEVRPFIRTGAAADDVVQLYRPSCKAIILPGTYDEQGSLPDNGSISFDAIQVKP